MKAILILCLMFPMLAFGKSYKSKKRLKRKPAQASLSVNDLSPEFIKLRNEIIGGVNKSGTNVEGIQTADQLDNLIIELDKQENYKKYKNDDAASLLAAQIAFLKVYRGLIFRAKGLVKKHDFVKSSLITALRFTGQATQVYLPSSQWEAGFNYFVEPFKFTSNQRKIEDDEGFKRYLESELIPALIDLDRRVEKINFDNIIWDNKVFYKDANFVDERDRFVRLSINEKRALRSAIYGSLSASKGLVAYSLKGFFATIDEVVKKYGINASFSMNKSLAKERTQIIKNGVSLYLRDSKALGESYTYLVKSVRFAKQAINGMDESRDRDPWALMNVTAVNAFSRVNGRTLDNITNIVLPEGNGRIASAVVDGQVVEFDIKSFFEKKTAPKTLKAFLPNKFDDAMNNGRVKKGFVDRTVMKEKLGEHYIDFTYGRPIGWDQNVFKKYFPNVKSDEDIKKVVRIISQSYGGAGLGGPLSLVMF